MSSVDKLVEALTHIKDSVDADRYASAGEIYLADVASDALDQWNKRIEDKMRERGWLDTDDEELNEKAKRYIETQRKALERD